MKIKEGEKRRLRCGCQMEIKVARSRLNAVFSIVWDPKCKKHKCPKVMAVLFLLNYSGVIGALGG